MGEFSFIYIYEILLNAIVDVRLCRHMKCFLGKTTRGVCHRVRWPTSLSLFVQSEAVVDL